MVNKNSLVILTGLLALGAFGLWLFLRHSANPNPIDPGANNLQTTPPPASAPKEPGPALPEKPEVKIKPVTPTKDREIAKTTPMIPYPDGTYLPTLNGVKEKLDRMIKWPSGRLYSPVIGVHRFGDHDWYIHADGCRSTCFYTEATRLGKKGIEPIALVSQPGTPLPNVKMVKAAEKTAKPKPKDNQ